MLSLRSASTRLRGTGCCLRAPASVHLADLPAGGLAYPDDLNAAVELADRMVEQEFSDHVRCEAPELSSKAGA